MSTVLVTGGTGALGTELVPRLVTAGHVVRVLSRRERPEVASGATTVRGDLATGAGLDAAVAGVDVIAHLASGTGGIPSYRRAKRTDVDGTMRLIDAAKAAGSPHVVYISIVGVDVIPFGYYRAKFETERILQASGLPLTILRTTQWHSLAMEFCRRLTKPPVVLVPKNVRMQLLDASEVADRMAALVDGPAAGHVTDMGGPDSLDVADIARRYLAAFGKRRVVGTFPVPGKLGRSFREGQNLAPRHADGRITWDEYLASRVAAT